MQRSRDTHSGDTEGFREPSTATQNAKKSGDRGGGQGSRTRPTNNQLLYRATFQWEHYLPKLQNSPTLPLSTEACASVTSAFLQVIGVLFEVESIREDHSRNILRLLANNTRRTKVVELSSGTHRVPEELKRHSISDGEGGQYSTNLDRNRYGVDDQYLATVVRYNLDFLELCPLLVDITILDAKGGNVTTTVSADPESCRCNPALSRPALPVDTRLQRLVKTVRAAWAGPKIPDEEGESRQPRSARAVERSVTPAPASPEHVQPAVDDRQQEQPVAPPSRASGGNQPLFDALLMAATEPHGNGLSPNNQKVAPVQRSSDSRGDSPALEESHATPPEGLLRRSSRRSKRLFNTASIEQDETEASEDEQSSPSIEGTAGGSLRRTRASSERWEHTQRRSRSKRQHLPPVAFSEANLPRLAWASPSEPKQPQRLNSLQLEQEMGRLRKQLQSVRNKLLQSEEREAIANEQIDTLQQSLAKQKAELQEAELRALEVQGEVRGEHQLQKSRETPESDPYQGNTAASYLSTMLKEMQASVGRLKHEKAVLQRTLLAAGLPFPQLPTDLAPPQEWTGVTPLGLPTMAPASLPHIATPNSAYSAFSVPSTSQAPQATGFKPCQQNPSMSQGHYVVPMSAPLNGLPRPSISQALPFTALNGIGPPAIRSLPNAAASVNLLRNEPPLGLGSLMNGPIKAPKALPLQEISKQANSQQMAMNHATKRKREGEETNSVAQPQAVSR